LRPSATMQTTISVTRGAEGQLLRPITTRLARLTLPSIVSPSLRLLPLAKLRNVLHDAVDGAAEERLVLVVEGDDDQQLGLAMRDGRAKDVVPLVEVLGL